MSILRNLVSPERRALTPNQAWARGWDWGGKTAAGVNVTQDNATALATVYACVSLISDTIATLPVDVYYRYNGERRAFRPKPAWVTEPLPGVPGSRISTYSQIVQSLLLDGNAFVVCTPSIYDPQMLEVVDPRRVTVGGTQAEPEFTVSTERGAMMVDRSQIVHLKRGQRPGDLRGVSPIEETRQSIGIGLAAQRHAGQYLANGLQLSGVIKVPGEMNAEDAKALIESFEAAHSGDKAYRAGILTGGAEWTPLTVSPKDAQFLESRQFQVTEIARIFRVPPMLIGDNEPGAVSYASSEQAAIAFEKHTLRPLLSIIEDSLSPLVPTPDSFLKFTTDGLLRGDPKTRYDAYEAGLRSGWLSINDVRRLEDMTPVDGGDAHRVQMQMVDITTPTPASAAPQVGQ